MDDTHGKADQTHGRDVQDALAPLARALRAEIPQVCENFAGLHRAAMQEGALATSTKELIAPAIAVVERCSGCIASHARGAARAGATREQVAEAIGVAILMAGGPATVYGPRAYSAFCDFHDA
jgi:AhpD family alkylhydroperoxidase